VPRLEEMPDFKVKGVDYTYDARVEVTKNYVDKMIPEVKNDIPIWKYTDVARNWYSQIFKNLSVLQKGSSDAEFRLAFCHLTAFVKLVMQKMPHHNGFNTPGNKKDYLWCKDRGSKCMDSVEKLVRLWNEVEANKLEDDLMGQFGDLDDLEGGTVTALEPPSSLSSGYGVVEASAPPLPMNMTDVDSLLDTIKPQAQDAIDVSRQQELYEDIVRPKSDQNRALLAYVDNPFRFISPPPETRPVSLVMAGDRFNWIRYDYSTMFLSFFPCLPTQLQLSPSACEANRCFWLHLGVATSVHPFALQLAFRSRVREALSGTSLAASDFSRDVVTSVVEVAGFVDANVLAFLWPIEFENTRVCLMSGPLQRPSFTVFFGANCPVGQHMDVLMRCDQDHFTLLGPQKPGEVDRLLRAARNAGMVVLESPVTSGSYGAAVGKFSLHETLASLS